MRFRVEVGSDMGKMGGLNAGLLWDILKPRS